MRTDPTSRRSEALRLIRNGLITLSALFLVFAAFHDITAGDETDLTAEYFVLCACAAWLAFVALRLIQAKHRVLGGISLVALAAALWGQREIGPGIRPGFWPSDVATAGAFFWFVVLSGLLLALGWRAHRERRAEGSPGLGGGPRP
jgi:hypothetical protein